MAVNLDAIRTATDIGQTPGFRIHKQDDSRYKVTREAIPEHGVEESSLVLSPRASEQHHLNTLTRIKRDLGWTPELYHKCQEIDRQHRLTQTDPAADHFAALLEALGIDPTAPTEEAPAVPAPRRRHSRGGTATGSAKKPTTAATPAGDPAIVEDGSVPVLLPTKVYHQLELITPERAMHLLVNKAPYQRDTKVNKTKALGGAMERDEFMANPADSVCVDVHGQTCNGAHRLTAVLESMKAQPMWVAYNVPVETYTVMDRGTKRSTADMFSGAGETNTPDLAAVARLAWLWFNAEPGKWKAASEGISEAQVYATLEDHPGLRKSVELGKIKSIGVSRSAAMLAHYLIAHNMDDDVRVVTRWFQAIAAMELPLHQPGHSLGMYYLRSKTGASRRKPLVGRTRREVDLYLIIQAWNATCVGKEMRTVGAPHPGFKIADPIAPIPGRAQFLPFD